MRNRAITTATTTVSDSSSPDGRLAYEHNARASRYLASESNPMESRYPSTDPCFLLACSNACSITSFGAPRNLE